MLCFHLVTSFAREYTRSADLFFKVAVLPLLHGKAADHKGGDPRYLCGTWFSTAPWVGRGGPWKFGCFWGWRGKNPHRWKSRRAEERALRYQATCFFTIFSQSAEREVWCRPHLNKAPIIAACRGLPTGPPETCCLHAHWLPQRRLNAQPTRRGLASFSAVGSGRFAAFERYH